MNVAPGPFPGGPSAILHDDGASTESTGTCVLSSAAMTLRKGSRTSPEKLKPKMASMMWSVLESEAEKSSVKGMESARSWVVRPM